MAMTAMRFNFGGYMSDFNYNEYPNSTLHYAIAQAHREIKEARQTIRSFSKKLERPRGYSHARLNAFEASIRSKTRLIKSLQREIAECQWTLDSRAQNYNQKLQTQL